MKIALGFLGQLSDDLYIVRQQFVQLGAQISKGWLVNHRTDGTHGPLTIVAALMVGDLAVVTPGQLLANADNYNPVGLDTAIVLRVSSDASRNLTGLTAPNPPQRRFRLLCNVGGQNIVLVHASTASNVANRFDCPGAANLTLNTKDSVWLWYDVTSLVWRVIGF